MSESAEANVVEVKKEEIPHETKKEHIMIVPRCTGTYHALSLFAMTPKVVRQQVERIFKRLVAKQSDPLVTIKWSMEGSDQSMIATASIKGDSKIHVESILVKPAAPAASTTAGKMKLSRGWQAIFAKASKESLQTILLDLLERFDRSISLLCKAYSTRSMHGAASLVRMEETEDEHKEEDSVEEWWNAAAQREIKALALILPERARILAEPQFTQMRVPIVDFLTVLHLLQKRVVTLYSEDVITNVMSHFEHRAEERAIYACAHVGRDLMTDQRKPLTVPILNHFRSLTFEPAVHSKALGLAWNEIMNCFALIGYLHLPSTTAADGTVLNLGDAAVELCYCPTMRTELGAEIAIDREKGNALVSQFWRSGGTDYSDQMEKTYHDADAPRFQHVLGAVPRLVK